MWKTANRPAPPSTSQVSLPSQIGATENIMRSRQVSLWAWVNMIPTPRSKPSAITYMTTAKPSAPAQISGSQEARPSYCVPKPNMGASSLRRLRAPPRPAFEALVGHRERPPRRPAGPVAEIRTACRLLDRLRALPQQLGDVVGAKTEYERIDDDEGGERGRDCACGNGRDRIRRALQTVDHIRLAPDLGREPAEQHRAEARRRHGHGGAQKPAVLVQAAF